MRDVEARSAAPAQAEEAEAQDIVVTSRRVASKSSRRGDWNACTVNDPRQDITRCRRGAAHLDEGLKLAWSGDNDGAIAAFDKAIEAAPRSSSAYLNRGLAYHRGGDPNRALADLDRAVRLDPGSARAYYNRSRVLRGLGKERRAREDEEKAVSLDPRYADALE